MALTHHLKVKGEGLENWVCAQSLIKCKNTYYLELSENKFIGPMQR